MGKSYGELFKHYTDKGEELKQQIRSLHNKRNQFKDDIDYAESQLSALNKRNRMNQQNAWLQKITTQSTMQEPTKQSYPGFKLKESTTPAVDNALKNGQARVVEMSPKEYIERVNYQIFNKYTMAQNVSGRSYKVVNEYAEMMRQGVKFDTPYLDYENEGQEGIHRALAAIQNGYERIPVIVVPKKRKN
jgi:chromosome segregation ATPase